MRVHVAGSSSELRRICELLELTDLLLETYCEDIEFLAYACRRCRLAVGLREHRDVLPVLCHAFDQAENLLEERHEAFVDSFLE